MCCSSAVIHRWAIPMARHDYGALLFPVEECSNCTTSELFIFHCVGCSGFAGRICTIFPTTRKKTPESLNSTDGIVIPAKVKHRLILATAKVEGKRLEVVYTAMPIPTSINSYRRLVSIAEPWEK